MKSTKSTVVAVCVLSAVVLVGFLMSVPGSIADDATQLQKVAAPIAPTRSSAGNELSKSIVNGKVCRFTFRLEHTDVVNLEEARRFMARYQKSGSPKIIGAYPDADANLLVVIGPPEAEEAIRHDLASMVIEMHLGTSLGDDDGNLKIRMRTLQSKGRTLIRENGQHRGC